MTVHTERDPTRSDEHCSFCGKPLTPGTNRAYLADVVHAAATADIMALGYPDTLVRRLAAPPSDSAGLDLLGDTTPTAPRCRTAAAQPRERKRVRKAEAGRAEQGA